MIKEGDRYHSYAVNLNHNMLTGALETLPDFIRKTLIQPDALSTLDLSFNVFTEIPTVSLRLTSISKSELGKNLLSAYLFQVVTQFPMLKYFYFHKNMLSDVNDIRKLVSLQELKYVTLHGNPIEINVPYLRSYVLCLLPGLRSFNCTPVTKGDRKISEVWGGMNRNLLPKYSNKSSKK